MRMFTLNSRTMFLAEAAVRVVSWMAICAAWGALGGLVFGMMFAGIGNVLDAASWSVVDCAGYLAMCGAAAGVLVGGCGSLFETDTPSEPASSSTEIAEPITDPIAKASRFAPSRSSYRNRLGATTGTARPPLETLTSPNPSRN